MKEKVPHMVVQGVCIKVSYSITRHLGRDVRDQVNRIVGCRTGERETGEGEVMGARHEKCDDIGSRREAGPFSDGARCQVYRCTSHGTAKKGVNLFICILPRPDGGASVTKIKNR
jgi:hypothetical protein